MSAFKTLAASALLCLALPAMAEQVTLTFEDTGAADTQAGHRYESYLDSGIVFSDNAWIQRTFDTGTPCQDRGNGNFYNDSDPSCGAVLLRYRSDAIQSFVIGVANGFTDSFSMIYTALADLSSASVSVYDETHTLIGSQSLLAQATCPTDGFLCNWGSINIALNGQTAFFVEISGPSSSMYFDNMVFGDVNAGTGSDVPEPQGVALSFAALGALAWSRRRSSKKPAA